MMGQEITTNSKLFEFGEMWQMATAIAKSGLFGIQTPDQAASLMLVAQSEGRHPGIVARDYHMIQGRPSLKADAILARFQEAGGKVEWKTYTDDECTAVFSHPSGGSLTITWTMKMAQAAGLTNKAVWKQYKRSMLSARCISEGVRKVYPAVLGGMYTPEEVSTFDKPKANGKPKPAPVETPCEVVEPPKVNAKEQQVRDRIADATADCHTVEEWEMARDRMKAAKGWGKRSEEIFQEMLEGFRASLAEAEEMNSHSKFAA